MNPTNEAVRPDELYFSGCHREDRAGHGVVVTWLRRHRHIRGSAHEQTTLAASRIKVYARAAKVRVARMVRP